MATTEKIQSSLRDALPYNSTVSDGEDPRVYKCGVCNKRVTSLEYDELFGIGGCTRCIDRIDKRRSTAGGVVAHALILHVMGVTHSIVRIVESCGRSPAPNVIRT